MKLFRREINFVACELPLPPLASFGPTKIKIMGCGDWNSKKTEPYTERDWGGNEAQGGHIRRGEQHKKSQLEGPMSIKNRFWDNLK